MARVHGPLFSIEAAGKVADALVYFTWKGRPVLRRWLKPTNPNTGSQQIVRNYQRCCAAMMHWSVDATYKEQTPSSATERDYSRILGKTPSGLNWNAYISKMMIGSGLANMTLADAAYAALGVTAQTHYNTSATNAIFGLVDTGGVSAGQLLYRYRFGLYKMGLILQPTATPCVYA